jgi:hypothetical protein
MNDVSTFFLAATPELPRACELGVQLSLVTFRTRTAAHVIRAWAMFQTEVALDALQDVVT